MVGELIMLPIRVGVRATRLWFRAVEEGVSVASSATGRVVELVASRGSRGSQTHGLDTTRSDRDQPGTATAPSRSYSEREQDSDGDEARAPTPPAAPPRRTASPPPVDDSPVDEPSHVSEEPTLVEALAEPGAEDGAGAEVHVDPPWDGYDQLSAKQVIARLADADPAVLATVELYEASSRRRQTILNTVKRELRRVNGRGSRNSER